ncbi:50S ribosomal protein L6 [symbiont of Argiope bruennichi]|uniref:50S ribosomal protein L6 n=1 Tax=symbiont of Argiope bruennichi TaxID=2810479 RepID=UPI003DA605F2
MSRIGKRILTFPESVSCLLDEKINKLTVSGPNGTLEKIFCKEVEIKIDQDKKTIQTFINSQERKVRQLFGLTNSLVKNMLDGVQNKFSKKLKIVGVGYKAQVNENKLILSLGFSHPVIIEIPKNIELKLVSPTEIHLFSNDKQQVGQFAAIIRDKKKPEPYKGKGIMYHDEIIVRKAGKSVSK